jgi:hypothetical protein
VRSSFGARRYAQSVKDSCAAKTIAEPVNQNTSVRRHLGNFFAQLESGAVGIFGSGSCKELGPSLLVGSISSISGRAAGAAMTKSKFEGQQQCTAVFGGNESQIVCGFNRQKRFRSYGTLTLEGSSGSPKTCSRPQPQTSTLAV